MALCLCTQLLGSYASDVVPALLKTCQGKELTAPCQAVAQVGHLLWRWLDPWIAQNVLWCWLGPWIAQDMFWHQLDPWILTKETY